MSLKDKINDIRNKVVVSMSKVQSQGNDGTREIMNGKDKYVVSKTSVYDEETRFGQDDYGIIDKVSFEASDNSGNSETLSITKQRPKGECDDVKKKVIVRIGYKNSAELPYDTDIDDINSIRYQLGKKETAKQLAYFIDKFVIVTPKEREDYKEYAKRMDEKEALNRRNEKQERREQEKAGRLAKQQEKQQKKQHARDEALKAKRQAKIVEKFMGK